MKKHLNFNISLRPEIESGHYKVETKSGRPVKIIDWERKCYGRDDIVAKVSNSSGDSENILIYYSSGRLISDSSMDGPRNKDLVVVSDIEITDFNVSLRPKIESGELSAVTEYGEPVEIVKWDCHGNYPILAVIFDGNTDDSCFYNTSGVSAGGSKIYIQEKEKEIPLNPVEEDIKKAVLSRVSNGVLSNLEVKSLSGYLKTLLTPKETKKNLWSLASYDCVSSELAIIIRKSFTGKDKIFLDKRVRKGDLFCYLQTIGDYENYRNEGQDNNTGLNR